MTSIELPDAGERRYWVISHQPRKKTAPLRIELRERTNRNSTRIIDSFSRLIGFEDTTAADLAVIDAAHKILERAGKVDEFVGIYATNDTSVPAGELVSA